MESLLLLLLLFRRALSIVGKYHLLEEPSLENKIITTCSLEQKSTFFHMTFSFFSDYALDTGTIQDDKMWFLDFLPYEGMKRIILLLFKQ